MKNEEKYEIFLLFLFFIIFAQEAFEWKPIPFNRNERQNEFRFSSRGQRTEWEFLY